MTSSRSLALNVTGVNQPRSNQDKRAKDTSVKVAHCLLSLVARMTYLQRMLFTTSLPPARRVSQRGDLHRLQACPEPTPARVALHLAGDRIDLSQVARARSEHHGHGGILAVERTCSAYPPPTHALAQCTPAKTPVYTYCKVTCGKHAGTRGPPSSGSGSVVSPPRTSTFSFIPKLPTHDRSRTFRRNI